LTASVQSTQWDVSHLAHVLSAMDHQSHSPPDGLSAVHHLSAFAGLAIAVMACLAISAVAGALAAAVLRRRDQAWTWGLLALMPFALAIALVVLGATGIRAASISLALSAGLAAGTLSWGLRGRLADRRAGGDRESAAAARRGLLDPLRRCMAERRGQVAQTLGAGLPIGRTHRGELVCVPRGSARSGCHVLIPGATGAGKTTSLAALLIDYVVRSGFGAVVLEAKNDAALYDAAAGAAAARGTAFHLISPDGPSGYDPLACGSVDERSERLIATQGWGSDDADFYRQAASPFLRLVLRVLDAAAGQPTLAAVARYCDPDELENLVLRDGGESFVTEVAAAVNGLRADERRAIAGMHARLRNLASSEFAGTWLDPHRTGADSVDLRAAIDRREVVYFRFDTDRTGNVGRAIAQMVLLDLGAAASSLMDAGVGTFVGIDEFGALEAPALERVYARGRAAGFSVAVGTQTLADLRAAGPAVRERVAATVSAVLCHRIGGQDDAEWVARLIGTVPTWETTIRTHRWGLASEDGTRTRGYRFEVNPAELQRLESGEAYVACLQDTSPTRSARVRVVPPWERLRGDAES
jgi:hypothetical protein